jgi:hypothetical protein
MRKVKVENTKFQSPEGSRRDRHTKYYKTPKKFSDKSSSNGCYKNLKTRLRFWKLTLKIIQAALQINTYYSALNPTHSPNPGFALL